MRQTAERLRLSYDWFRRVWPAMCHDEGFPAPFHARAWDEAAVEAWIAARSRPHAAAPAANDRATPPPTARLRAQRAALAELRRA